MEYSLVNLNLVGVKAKSKGELYRTLVTEGKMYLMGQKECGLEFISDICVGRKKALYTDAVKVCQVPHLKGLRIEQIIDFIVMKCDGECYLPRNYMKYPPNRSWLCNVANTLNQEGFDSFIKDIMESREQYFLKKQNLVIKMDKRIAKIFKDSKNVSIEKGKSHKLLRKALIEEEKDSKKQMQKQLEDAAKANNFLKFEIEKLRYEIQKKDEENQRQG